MTTPPRYFRPGGVYLITRRTTQRQFLLRPEKKLNQNVLYLLAVALEKFPVRLHAVCVLSNHIHLVVTDPTGESVPAFTQWFFSMLARSTNCLRGRWENFWASGKPSVVEIAPTLEDLVDNLAYVICNAVISGLVSRSLRWPGVVVLADQIGRKNFAANRPDFFYNSKGLLPKTARFRTSLPDCFDESQRKLRAALEKRCQEIERQVNSEYRSTQKSFVGRKSVLRVPVTAAPKTREPRRSLDPHVACKNADIRCAMLQERKTFLISHRRASQRFRTGNRRVVFPAGTYLMTSLFGCKAKKHLEPPWVQHLAA